MPAEKKYKSCGISVMTDEKGEKFPNFHVSRREGVRSIWMPVPGRMETQLLYLPREMTKLECAQYLSKHKDFQSRLHQDYINDLITKYNPDAEEKPRKAKTKKTEGVAKIKATSKKKTPEKGPVEHAKEKGEEKEVPEELLGSS